MTSSMTRSHFNPMTSASNDMNKIEEAAFDAEARKLAMLKECRHIRGQMIDAKFALTQLGLALDVLVAKLCQSDEDAAKLSEDDGD